MLADQARVDSFTEFVAELEPRLRRALTATFGIEAGRDAAAEALVYAWRHWDRVKSLENPAGYLYRVGRDRGRKVSRDVLVADLDGVVETLPWVEPGLPAALLGLRDQQRIVVTLIHGYEWSYGEVAELLGVAKGTVQTHEKRAMAKLRDRLGVKT